MVVLKDKGVPKGGNYIEGMKGFWSVAKHWLYHYHKYAFSLLLKRSGVGFNHWNENLVILLRRLMNQQNAIVKEQI